ncbi:DUF5665 domain-containing protein [Paenibacillus oryzae]|uniref:DUF5665 domain-containing protein n=1 Tax=Paenibacillus oryzae TaxID=1844972 RepID=UPI000B1DFAAE|nr:DUF5665 domain-containing protein [Paenibacillus oryzae]
MSERGGNKRGRGSNGLPSGANGEPQNLNALEKSLGVLNKRMEHIASEMERTHIAEYVDLLNRPFSLIWRNLLAGTARGVGIAIGFTFFAATILYLLQLLGALNLPIIGDYIAEIVKIVQIQLEGKGY